ncbi:MAG: formyltransferase family protein [Candidatus Ozemobacteraceae bacterium]
MTNLDNEKLVNYLVVLHKPGRQFIAENDTRWGELILPAPSENPEKNRDGLRVVLFGSWDYGYLLLETLKEYEHRYPGKLNLVGLVTDNPLNPDAKISFKKRIWNYIDLPHRVLDETFIIESGLTHGIPVYTGEIKIESFYRLLQSWKPDAILVCVFGQKIDSHIITIPPFGIYNFHPSDLRLHQGAGPAPYDDLFTRKAETTVWSIHHVTEEIDSGHVVGQSPPVNVVNAKGILPDNPLVVYRKLCDALSSFAFFLIEELRHRFEMNKPGSIDQIDFNSLISDHVKKRLMECITDETPTAMLPIPDKSLFT